MKKLYVASSWRNPYQPTVVDLARTAGLDVYDFRNPKEGNHGFSWRQVAHKPIMETTFEEYREILQHPIAEEGYRLDMAGLQADATILVMPAGRSAHFELGYAQGQGQKTAILFPTDVPMAHKLGNHGPTSSVCIECHPEYAEHGGIPTMDRYTCKLRTKLRDDFEPELMIKGAEFLIGRMELTRWLLSLL